MCLQLFNASRLYVFNVQLPDLAMPPNPYSQRATPHLATLYSAVFCTMLFKVWCPQEPPHARFRGLSGIRLWLGLCEPIKLYWCFAKLKL